MESPASLTSKSLRSRVSREPPVPAGGDSTQFYKTNQGTNKVITKICFVFGVALTDKILLAY